MSNTNTYDLNSFLNLTLKLNRDEFKLNNEVITQIHLLKTVLNIKEDNLSDKKKKINIEFKVTKFNKSENEVDKNLTKIRVILNKINEKTIEKYTEELVTIIKDTQLNTQDHLTQILDLIFNIASSNSFYVELYANLYNSLFKQFDFIKELFDKKVESYLDLFKNIETCDSKENYDKFCEINELNAKRMAISGFYVELMKLGLVESLIIENMIIDLQTILINNKNNSCQVDFNVILSENICQLIVSGYNVIKSSDNWEIIENNLNIVKNSLTSNNKGISNKVRFKHMDTYDIINKT